MCNVIGQRERRLLAATVGLTGGLARLPRFRCVDAKEPDALAVDLDRVAVDDRGAAGQVRGNSRRHGRADQDNDEGAASSNGPAIRVLTYVIWLTVPHGIQE